MFRIIYFLSLLLYFALAQADVVNYLCSMILSRPAPQWPWLYAPVLTALCYGVTRLLSRCLGKYCGNTYWPYVITSCLAALSVSFPFASTTHLIVLPLAALVSGVLIHLWLKRLQRLSNGPTGLWHTFLPPTVILTLLGLYMGIGAAAPDYVHYELRTAGALRGNHPRQAYKIGETALATSPRLFALRCYLLATTDRQGLGHQIFKQPVPRGGSSILLFPTDRRQSLTLPADTLYRTLGSAPRPGESTLAYLRRCAVAAKTGNPHEKYLPAIDYYLCALLLDRRIDLFAQEIRTFYPLRIRQHKLPSYYAQALVLYTRSRTRPSIVYRDGAVEANLRDYSEMSDTISCADCRRNLLRRSYGETYWWWYEYEK